ncbi:hypothetical protein BDV40DRAFT_277919 [Aspergillus tamarii]|uniref:Uncharacterized protein n=1 Tax=Aspergillus tamarii TaxID=41984 RepID=A0A5N6UG35_ASPTM|nr:hypothetical protein BDV40DRAFT_277919 [Aspergillus tamarii]
MTDLPLSLSIYLLLTLTFIFLLISHFLGYITRWSYSLLLAIYVSPSYLLYEPM